MRFPCHAPPLPQTRKRLQTGPRASPSPEGLTHGCEWEVHLETEGEEEPQPRAADHREGKQQDIADLSPRPPLGGDKKETGGQSAGEVTSAAEASGSRLRKSMRVLEAPRREVSLGVRKTQGGLGNLNNFQNKVKNANVNTGNQTPPLSFPSLPLIHPPEATIWDGFCF